MNRSRNIIIILIVIIAVLIIALIGAMVYIFMDNNKDNDNIVVNTTNDNTAEDDGTANIEDEIERVAMETFNETFDIYGGTEIASSQVRLLLFAINTNNAEEGNEHIVNLNEDGITDMNQLNDNKTYTVEIFYDDAGYVNEIKITENTTVEPVGGNNSEDTIIDSGNTTGDVEKLSFNSTFISYIGEINGESLNMLLQEAMESNNKYPEHQVNLSSNNLQTLEGIIATDMYTISISYDAEGYVNNINIDKKI